MATANISEYERITHGLATSTEAVGSELVPVQIIAEPALASDNVTPGGTSTAYGPFNASTRVIQIVTDTALYYKVSSDSTDAASGDRLMLANTERYVGVEPGWYIEVIEASL